MLSRRHFLQTSSLVSLSPWIPDIFGQTAQASPASRDSPVLVVIQLDGGNDGINTVVPLQDDAYNRARAELLLKPDELHKVDDQVGLHKEMKAAKQLFDDGRLSIIHSVGYPNPNRSHFTSMRIWESAYLEESRHNEDGWLGRTLDARASSTSGILTADAIHIGDQETPLSLWGKRSTAISMKSSTDLTLDLKAIRPQSTTIATDDDSLQRFATRQFTSAIAASSEFAARKAATNSTSKAYPDTKLATQLKFVSQMLQSNSPARVFYTIQSGYDTHTSQLNTHARLLREFSDGLKAFLDDLREAKLDDRVVVLAFSEFGRRVEENDSHGTDHGTAGPVFLSGVPVQGGQIGHVPSLSDLQDGDLKVQVDFRRVYASILEQFFKLPSEKILGSRFEALDLFKQS